MTYSVRNPPAKSKHTLQIRYGGHFETESDPTYQNYQNYTGESAIWVENLDDYSGKACWDDVNDLASKLGYRNTREVYRRHKGRLLEITSHDDVTEMISQLGANRELVLYIVGQREEEAQAQNPTILSWNCRGLNRPSTRAMLRVLILIYNPTIIILIETRLSSSAIGKISHFLGFQNFRASSAKRNVAYVKNFTANTNEDEDQDQDQDDSDNCVGLAVLWKSNLKLELSDNSDNYLDFEVEVPGTDKIWKFTAFYGHPTKKRLSWMWLEQLKLSNDRSQISEWLVVGDLNEISNQTEKVGGSTKNPADISRFTECLEKCSLQDLSFEGDNFTWTGPGGVRERLDRGVASWTWIKLFPHHAKVLHLTDKTISDHIPILVETDSRKQKLLKTETLMVKMETLLSFVAKVEREYQDTDLATVSLMKTQMRKIPDFYFDIAQNVAPHIFQVKYIAVHVHNEDKDIVKYERLVTLTICSNLRELLLNCMAIPMPSRKYDIAISEEFPSLSCQKSNVVNFSEYLVQTWKLVELIPADRKIFQQEVLEQKIYEQVENLIRWYTQVKKTTNDIGDGYSNILKKLEEEASRNSRAVIVCNTMISLFRGGMIKPQGTITELNVKIYPEYLYYFPLGLNRRGDCGETIEFLLDTSGWRHLQNGSEYNITEEQLIQRLTDLEERMFKTNRDIMLVTNRLRPWIKLIIDNDTEKKKLARFVDTSTIKSQLELLQQIGCISISKNNEIALEADNDRKSIVDRLENAADEAFKTLKNKSTKTKSMTYSEYLYKLKEAYKSGKVAKRKIG